MKKLITLILVLSGVVAKAQLFPNLGGQRAGVSALSFLKNDMSPRSLGLGGASLAIDGDNYSIMNNPASLTDTKGWGFSSSNMVLGADINQTFFSVTKTDNNLQTFGLSINTLNAGAMEVRTELQPNGTGEYFYASDLAVGLTFSKMLSDNFTLGVTGKYIYEQLAQYHNHTAAVDLAFRYNTDYKDLKFAVMVQNFSSNSTIKGTFLPNAFNRDTVLSLDKYSVPTAFMMGFSLIPWKKDNQSLLFAMQLNHPNDNAENLRFGLEYNYMKLLFIRMGYKVNVKGQNLPNFGVGYRTRIGRHPLYVDYAVQPTNYFGFQHCFGLQFQLNNAERDAQ